mgnify:FL=1
MAKGNLPRIDDAPVKQEQPQQQETRQEPAQIIQGYVPKRIDVKLPPKHRNILHTKLRQLQDSGARLEDGTEVSDRTKAVLWILENEVAV